MLPKEYQSTGTEAADSYLGEVSKKPVSYLKWFERGKSQYLDRNANTAQAM